MYYYFIFIISINAVISHPVVNGTDGDPNEFPYVVSLRDRNGVHFCGGAIISEYHVISAHHCMKGDHLKKMVVVAGTSSRTKARLKYTFKVTKIYRFNNKKWLRTINEVANDEHDIMILKLDRQIPISNKVKIATLPKNPPVPNTKITFAGWGDTNTTIEPDPIQKFTTTILPINECAIAANDVGFFLPYEMCTFSKEGQGLCDGDSGTPLIKDGVLIGIALWVSEICGDGIPDYFANIFYYKSFIENYLQPYDTTDAPTEMPEYFHETFQL